ncbi:sugar phosphate isomerase/epimerase [Paenibacillus mesophilus]|uniref:sugar phosphate isomerase/epimerase family protein n=1 Tax=Paenibacillus mesophilus TaxID=2582849 RepID=UPI00110DAD01|nr:sugar phosphate isomerase/epimerase family protein [Paenibacillus mesophilus]TMV49514.1 sugar phosphate isomerase/epimerase [Paenibacillus mesophilus]
MFTYSATQWIFGNEPMETSLQRLRRFGYDGVELAGEPAKLDFNKLQEQMKRHGLICTSICGIYTAERDLSHPDPEVRRGAIQYVKDCVDMAQRLGASVVIVVPTPVGKNGPITARQDEWANVVRSLQEAGEYAHTKKIRLAIEALNRFETYLVNTLAAAKQLAEAVNVASVGVMADLFHMNIEERNHSEALRDIAPYLAHVHIADNTREAAGLGQTDFTEVFRTLIELGYRGNVTMEFLPRVSNPYKAAEQNGSGAIYDNYAKQSIEHIRGIVERLI